MKKTLKDDSQAEDVYEIPDNVRARVADIEARAAKTYPDHADSRAHMIRQELIAALSELQLHLDSVSH